MAEAETAAARLAVSRLQADDHDEWDAFVRRTPGASFAHLAGWRDILRDVMGYQPSYLLARDQEHRFRAVFPLALLRSRVFGRRLVSLPLLSYGGPIGDAPGVTALLDAVVTEAHRSDALLEVRSRHPLPTDLPARSRKVTVVLPLPGDPETLWGDLRSKVRSQVRKPMKEGMATRLGPDQLDPFYEVFSHNMRDLGTPVLPKQLFREIASRFPDEAVFAAVYAGDRPVAAGAGFAFGGEFEITWASSLREFSRSAPNMLLYWSLMEAAIERGLRAFNFGRCTPDEGTHRFKLQWGGHDEPLPWLTWTGAAEDAGPGRVARVASSLWRHLPTGVANRLGPAVARRLPWW